MKIPPLCSYYRESKRCQMNAMRGSTRCYYHHKDGAARQQKTVRKKREDQELLRLVMRALADLDLEKKHPANPHQLLYALQLAISLDRQYRPLIAPSQ
jgi:hypothetical protein